MIAIRDMTEADYRVLLTREITNVLEILRRVGFILAERPDDPLTRQLQGPLDRARNHLAGARGLASRADPEEQACPPHERG